MAAALRNNIGALLTKTGAATIATGNYGVQTDALLIDNTTNNALLADFGLTVAFTTTPPTLGAIVLVAADWSLESTPAQPAAPTITLINRYVGTFDRQPQSSNALLTWKCRINAIPLTAKTDFYLLNAGTGQTISASWILTAQCWSPG